MDHPTLPARVRRRAVLATSAAVLALAPAAALATSTVIAGHQSLKLGATLTPKAAGHAGSGLGLHIAYESTVPGQRVNAPTKDIQVQLPVGLKISPRAATQCTVTQIVAAKGNVPKACPTSSRVGSGTLTADARPTVATPVPGTVQLFNVHGMHDDIAFYVTTRFGSFFYYFNILSSGRRQVLDAGFSRPTSGTSLFTLRTIDLTIHDSSTHRHYVTNPASCPQGGWGAALRISSYGTEPAIRATSAIACTK